MSQPEVKKRHIDVLANLPEHLRQQILENFPLKDAVKTSTLSRHWRYEWCKLQQIIFDQQLTNTFFLTIDDSSISTVYSNIITNVLHRQVGTLRKFVLCIPSYVENSSFIDDRLQLVFDKRVSELTLTDLRNGNEKLLPSRVFLYAGLTHLTLISCKFTLPPTFAAFPKLICLELVKCDVNSADHIRLISNNQLLKFLRLDYLDIITGANYASLNAPKLEHLIIEGSYRKLALGNSTTNIKKLELDFPGNSRFIVYKSVPGLQSLRLGTSFLQSINHETLGKEQKIDDLGPLEIRSLVLDGVLPLCPYIYYFVLKLLNNSRNVEKLYYEVAEYAYCKCGIPPLVSSWDLPYIEEGNFKSLKYAEFVYVTPSSIELEFIKVILENAPVLERMTITLSEDVGVADARARIVRNVKQYSRASRIAQIIFKN